MQDLLGDAIFEFAKSGFVRVVFAAKKCPPRRLPPFLPEVQAEAAPVAQSVNWMMAQCDRGRPPRF
eukprot:3323739-Lingulodinium_polyedra.AAC.1